MRKENELSRAHSKAGYPGTCLLWQNRVGGDKARRKTDPLLKKGDRIMPALQTGHRVRMIRGAAWAAGAPLSPDKT